MDSNRLLGQNNRKKINDICKIVCLYNAYILLNNEGIILQICLTVSERYRRSSCKLKKKLKRDISKT